jgi:hypothetical protein
MGVSGQHHAPAALYPRGKDSRYSLDRRLGGLQSRSGHRGYKKSSAPAGDQTPIVQPVAKHYIAWATSATLINYCFLAYIMYKKSFINNVLCTSCYREGENCYTTLAL